VCLFVLSLSLPPPAAKHLCLPASLSQFARGASVGVGVFSRGACLLHAESVQFTDVENRFVRDWVLASVLVSGCAKKEEGASGQGGGASAPAAAARAALAKGTAWLAAQQRADGTFGDVPEVGIAALCVAALAKSPQADQPAVSAAIEKGVALLLAHQRADGAFTAEGPSGYENYRTAIAVMALHAVDPQAYAGHIKDAQAFLVSMQMGHHSGADPQKDKAWFGGWNYRQDKGRADLSNTQMSMEALYQSGFDRDSEVWKNAIVFLQRCQNRSESNDGFSAGDDGGGIYAPIETKVKDGVVTLPNGKRLYKSYGSMTYALLKCYIYAGLQKDDPRVQAAYGWVRKHYDLDENPGVGWQGLYYYYSTMATALALYEKPTLTDSDGRQRNWAADLVQRLSELQREDGSWVNGKADRWMEGNPALATAYAALALEASLDVLASRRP